MVYPCKQLNNGMQKSIYGLNKQSRYLDESEMKREPLACVYSKLYYREQIFLTPNLKGDLFNRLLSTSTNIVKTCYSLRHWNLVPRADLHLLSDILTPKQMSNYTAGLVLYDSLRGTYGQKQRNLMINNTITEIRMNKTYIIPTNLRKSGLQLPENHLRKLSSIIPTDWFNMSRDWFKKNLRKLAKEN